MVCHPFPARPRLFVRRCHTCLVPGATLAHGPASSVRQWHHQQRPMEHRWTSHGSNKKASAAASLAGGSLTRQTNLKRQRKQKLDTERTSRTKPATGNDSSVHSVPETSWRCSIPMLTSRPLFFHQTRNHMCTKMKKTVQNHHVQHVSSGISSHNRSYCDLFQELST